jgi:hypothetical protein
LEEDIKKVTEISGTSEVIRLQKLDKLAWERGERVLFVPTFYAWGRVPAANQTGQLSQTAKSLKNGMSNG